MHCNKRIHSMRYYFLLAAAFLAGGLLPFHQALAQGASGRVVVRGVNTDTFPDLGVEFEVYDPLGGFVTNLDAQDVQVDEAGKPRSAASLELLQPGVQFTIAFNLAPELSNKYAGASRMDNILQRLGDWTKVQKDDTPDAVSLATNTGLQVIRSRSPQEWRDGLQNLETVNLLSEDSSLNALTRAVDLATDTSADSAVKQAILYITPLFGGRKIPELMRGMGEGVRGFKEGMSGTS